VEFFRNIFGLPLAEQLAGLHGLLAILALPVYGAIVTLAALGQHRNGSLHRPLTCLLGIQTLLLGAVSTAGTIIYVAYRAPGGAREFLLSGTETAWLHRIVFEYKEYLGGITPWLLMMAAFFVAMRLGPRLYDNKPAIRSVLAMTVVSALFLMLTTAMAVLVSKIAPLQKFEAGGGFMPQGGNAVLIAAILAAAVIAGIFWLAIRKTSRLIEDREDLAPAGAIMYGSAAGLTVMWMLNIAKEVFQPLKDSLAYINGVGPYSGVLTWSLVTIIATTVMIRLATAKGEMLSLNRAGWVLVGCALVQVLVFFPPFYEMFTG